MQKYAVKEIPGVTDRLGLGLQNKAGQTLTRVLPREHIGHSKHPVPIAKAVILHMNVTKWSILKSGYVLCRQRWRSSIQSAKQDLEVTVAQIISSLLQISGLNWRKWGKPPVYDLNQITYDYTVEVTSRFKGLDLADRVPEKLWTEVHSIVQEVVT